MPCVTSDGMKFYARAIQLTFGVACVHAQVIKKIKQNRVMKVGTKLVIGSEWRLEDALEESEDSSKLSTAFIERLNLTIREESAYLNRRSPCHARQKRTLEDQLELLRCHYNFCRPHSALKFGSVARTPAMQACKQLKVTEQTYYRCRQEYGGLRTDQAKRLRELELENTRLERLVAVQAVDNSILREAASGNF